jgi:hypothetical protein
VSLTLQHPAESAGRLVKLQIAGALHDVYPSSFGVGSENVYF